MSRYGNVKAGAYTKMNLESSSDTDLENLNDIEKVLGKIGIRIRSTNTEFRSFSDVLEELSDKWINLDTVSKNAIATAMAGVRQREQFLVLMENMERVEELEQVSATSQGTAERKYAAYMETIESAQNRLSNAWSEMAQRLEESGVVKAFTDVAVFITQHLLPALNAFASFLISYNGFKIPTLIGNMGKNIASVTPRFGNGRDEMYQLMIDWQDQNKLVKDPITGKYHTKKSGFLEQYVDKQLGDDFVQGSNSLNKFSATVDKATGSVEKLVEQNQKDVEQNQEDIEDGKNLEKNQDKEPEMSHKLERLTKRRDTAKANLEQAEAAEKTAKANLEQAEAIEANKKELEQQALSEEYYAKVRADAAQQELDEYGQSAQANRAAIESEHQEAQANRESAQSEHQDAQANLKDAQTEYINAQANLKDAQTELQGAQNKLDSGKLKSGASSSVKGAVAGVGISALTSGITTGMSTEGSTKAKAATGAVSGVATAAAGGIGLAIGGPLGAAIGSSLGSMFGSIIAPKIAEALDAEENARKERVEAASKLVETLKSQETAVENLVKASRSENLLSDDVKSIRDNVQAIKDASGESGAVYNAFYDIMQEDENKDLLGKLKEDSINSLYDNLDTILADDSISSELRARVSNILERANIRSQKAAFEASKEGSVLTEADKKKILEYELKEAYKKSGVSNMGSMELTQMGTAAVEQMIATAAGKELTTEVRRMIQLMMKQDTESVSVQSLLAGGNYTLRDIVDNVYNLSSEVQNDLLDQAANALGMSVDDVIRNIDRFDTLTVGNLNSSLSDLQEAASSLVSRFQELASKGVLSLDSLLEIIKSNSVESTQLGEENNKVIKSINDYYQAIANSAWLEWTGGTASGANIFKNVTKGKDNQLLGLLETAGFGKDKTSLDNLEEALRSDVWAQTIKVGEGDDAEDVAFSVYYAKEIANLWEQWGEAAANGAKQIGEVVSAEADSTLLESIGGHIDERLKREQEALEEQKSALEQINKQREYENKLIEAKLKLENAQNEKKKVWREGVGWVYEADTSAIADAQKELEELDNEKNINELQTLIDELQAQRDWMTKITDDKAFMKAQEFMKTWEGNNESTLEMLRAWETAVKNPFAFVPAGSSGEELKERKQSERYYQRQLAKKALEQAYKDFKDTEGGAWLDKSNGSQKENQAYLGSLGLDDIKSFNNARKAFEDAYDNGYLEEEDRQKYKALFEKSHIDSGGTGAIYADQGRQQKVGYQELTAGSGNDLVGTIFDSTLTPTDHKADETTEGTRWNNKWRDYLYMYSTYKNKWLKIHSLEGNLGIRDTNDIKTKLQGYFLYNGSTNGLYYVGRDGTVYDVQEGKTTSDHVNGRGMMAQTLAAANGTLSAPGGPTLVNDDPQYGLEGIVTPQGTLTALPSKSGVVPADMTRNVWQLGEVAPNLVKQLVDINGKFNSPLGFGTDESFNVDHLDVHMVAQPGFDMDDFVRQLRAARDLSKHS